MSEENNTLTGFILSKATQSRKQAKKKDRSKKKTTKKNTPQQSTNLLTGALSSVTNLFKPDKGKAEEVESKQPKTSGGATGLAKILTEGFGSLTADTLGLAGGLAAITNILNQQLQAQSFTATGVQAITSILSDQLENQSSIVSGVKSLRPGGGVGKAPRATGGGSKGGGGSGNDDDTLTGALLQRAGDLGLGAAAARMATNPYGIAALIALAGSAMRIREVERMKPFVEETQTQIQEENKKKDTPWYKKLGNLFAGQALSSPQGPSNQIGLPTPGGMYSEGAIIQNNIIKKYSSGTMKFAGGMTGGMNSMIGEAGKEAVVDLNSRSARSMFNAKPSATPEGESDPGMQASGASTLAVVDQFIKGMGPLGAPVAQALGPDVSNLARTFGMSQTLPNIKVGGGRFREDAGAKKTRDKFLENLIAGSLEALDAKKKDEKQEVTPPNPTVTTPPPGVTPPQSNPSSNPASPPPSNGNQKPMDGKYSDPTSQKGAAIPDLTGEEGKHLQNKEVKQRYLPFRPESKWNKSHHILLNSGNGSFEVWEKPGIFNWAPKMVYQGKKDGAGNIQNSAIASEAFNEVRSFMRVHMPDSAKNTFKWISETDISNERSSRVRGDQEKGGTIKPSMKEGGAVKKPWWDFLGWVTGMKSVEQGKTGIYSDAPIGRMANRTASTNKAIQEMLGGNYEEGGTVKQPIMRDDVSDIRKMITASQMRQQGRNLLGTDKEFPGQPAVVGADLIAKPTASAAAPRSSPATSAPTPTAQSFDGLDTATIINLYQQSGPAPVVPVTNDEGQSTSSYVGDAFGSGIAFSVLTINPWGN
jgi:hypothetical protein